MMRMILTALTALVFVGAAGAHDSEETKAGVRDKAKLFSSAAALKAERAIKEVESEGGLQVLIETRESLEGKTAREVAISNAEAAKLKGLSVVVAKKERKVWTEPSGSAAGIFSKREQTRVTNAFTGGASKGNFDKGLLEAVAEIRRAALGFGLRDNVMMFSVDAAAKADKELESLREATRWGAVIETVESLDGKTPKEAALARAKTLKVRGLYVLIARDEHKVYAEPSESASKVFTKEKLSAIDEAMTTAFKVRRFDDGLAGAVEAIRRAAGLGGALAAGEFKAEAAPSAPLPAPSPDQKADWGIGGVKQPLKPQAGEASAGRPAAVPAPAPQPVPEGVDKGNGGGSGFGTLMVGGGAVLFVLWMISRMFRGRQASTPGPVSMGGPGYGPAQPPMRPAPAPGYGPGPGYGAPAAPPAQGGGSSFLTGMMGGAAGAVAGNILYDKFGRPHEGPEGPGHPHGGMVSPPDLPYGTTGDHGSTNPPGEVYNPDAGVEGDWGNAPAPDQEPVADQGGAEGDWGGGESGGAESDQDQGGDWSAGEAAPEESAGDADDGTGGSW